MLGSNCASADTLSSTADSLIPLIQVGSLYLHTRIRKICGLVVHALKFPSELIAEIMRCATFLNTDAKQVALCVDTREIQVLLPLRNHKIYDVYATLMSLTTVPRLLCEFSTVKMDGNRGDKDASLGELAVEG